MINRMWRAIKLDRTLYREVADNPSYTGEGIIIVVLVSILSSVGTFITGDRSIFAYIIQVVNGLLLGWVLWAVVAYFVGSKLFGGKSNIEEMLRTLAFASSPRIIGVLGFIPCIGWLFSLAGGILSLIAGIIAIREAMEFDTGKAIVTALIGFLLFIIASIIIGVFVAILAMPFGASS